jgi:hypothetical protein
MAAMTKTIDDINIHTWFIDREVTSCPAHFTRTNTALTLESKIWIQEKLFGRFYINSELFSHDTPSFEDPKDAIFYELTFG